MEFALLPLFLSFLLSSTSGEINVGSFLNNIRKSISTEIRDLKEPVEEAVIAIAGSQWISYEELDGENEPDVNQLTLDFITNEITVTYNISSAAELIPQAKDFDPNQTIIIFIHGFTDNPTKTSFSTIKSALYSQGEYHVLALDASSLIQWLYLRSSTYVSFIGEKLGEVLAALVDNGVDESAIHIIGHSLGAHIAGFSGKQFTNVSGLQIGRISGLDPAGPCFSDVADDYKLKATDAQFVDVIHTDAGVFGLKESVGQVDFYPNEGSQQPNCLLQTCSHSRAWEYYAESISNPQAFPAVKCDDWDAFKAGECTSVAYMGFGVDNTTEGQYYLQTGENSPFGLGDNGTTYQDTDGVVKHITNLFG